MASNSVGLPPGFVLEEPTVGLPEGFVLEEPESVAAKARRRLEARGIDPSQPVDAEANRPHGYWTGLKESVIPGKEQLSEMASLVNLRGPVEQMKAAGRVIGGIAGAHVDQSRKAKDAFLRGDIQEGMGHGLAAAMPFVGPAVMGPVMEGNPEYAGGAATGLVLQALLPKMLPTKVRKMTAAAPDEIAAAEDTYASVFSKAKGERQLVDKMTPELMDRGVRIGDPKEVAYQAEKAADAIDVDSLVQQSGPIPLQSVLDEIDNLKAAEFHQVTDANGVTRSVPKNPDSASIVAGYDDYADILRQHAPNGEIDPVQALELRRDWERKAGNRNLFNRSDVNTTSGMEAQMGASNAVRTGLNADPSIAAANAEKSFQLNLARIAENAPAAKTPGEILKRSAMEAGAGGVATMVPVVGHIAGGVAGAHAIGKVLYEVPKTPYWKTTTSIAKRNFYKALQAKDYVTAADIGAKIASGLLVSDDFGTRDAKQQLVTEAQQHGKPELAYQAMTSKRGFYVTPDGTRVEIPHPIMRAYAKNPEGPNTVIDQWLRGQKQIPKGGRLIFE